MWAEQFGMIDSCMFYVFCAAVFVVVLLALVAMVAGCCLQDLSSVTHSACLLFAYMFLAVICCYAMYFVNFTNFSLTSLY